jgi:hypothetical protein
MIPKNRSVCKTAQPFSPATSALLISKLTFLAKILVLYNHGVRKCLLIHTQEVTGSSPVAPTIESIIYSRETTKQPFHLPFHFAFAD